MSTAHVAAMDGEDSAPPISTVAGTGSAGADGDGGPAVSAQVNYPNGVAMDRTGTLYVADYGGHRVRKITTDGKISTFAGTGSGTFGGDGGPAVLAKLKNPCGVAVDGAGNVYIADSENYRVRKVTPDGNISTVVGASTSTTSGDGGLATAARLNRPTGVAVDGDGVLYIADYSGHRVRKVGTDGKISTFAGTGSGTFGGDGGRAISAQLRSPYGVAVDGEGNLYIADRGNHRIRKVKPDGNISTIAGTGSAKFSGDGGPAAEAALNTPFAVVADSTGALYIADYGNHAVRKITADGGISTVAGTGTGGVDGDNGPAAAAQLKNPTGVALDCVDTLYISDHNNNRIRKVSSAKMAGLPDSGAVVSWGNVRSRLRMGVQRESVKDGAEIHQSLAAPRDHQRWRMVVVGHEDGEVLYTIQNLRSGKFLEVVGAHGCDGAVVAQRAYEGGDARHQQWRLIPVGSGDGAHRAYEIANGNSGLLLRVDSNARTAIRQHGAEGDHRNRQWELQPV
ncbi:RICIN domain-containing protein [Streptomyces sp. NPDC057509]|uniref:NHL domain-containing protein n=1 Tax=Streptomyces sp. NPDC057509 TaxID=3346152 RepID=UPI00367E29DB